MSDDLAELRDLDLPLAMRCRLAYLDGAEEHSRRTLGRGLPDDELRRVVRRYPRDLRDVAACVERER